MSTRSTSFWTLAKWSNHYWPIVNHTHSSPVYQHSWSGLHRPTFQIWTSWYRRTLSCKICSRCTWRRRGLTWASQVATLISKSDYSGFKMTWYWAGCKILISWSNSVRLKNRFHSRCQTKLLIISHLWHWKKPKKGLQMINLPLQKPIAGRLLT